MALRLKLHHWPSRLVAVAVRALRRCLLAALMVRPGLGVGFTVLAAAVAVGGVAGGAFKPAVGIGGGIIALVGWPGVLLFFVAEFAAAVVAGFALRALNPGDGSRSRRRRRSAADAGGDPRENGSSRA
jgi:glycerol uptake facilitator-like aquaporin